MQQKQCETFEYAVNYLDNPFLSVPTIELPSSGNHIKKLELLIADIGHQFEAGVVSNQGGFTPTKPGWVVRRGTSRHPFSGQTRREELIFYMWYGKHHMAVECTLPARALERVISNYEALTKAEQSRVPTTLHCKEKSFVANDMNSADKISAAQYAE